MIVSVGEELNEHLKLRIKRCTYGTSLIIDNYMVNGEYRDYVNLDGVEVDTRGQASVAFAFTGFSHSDATSGKSLYGDTYGANFTKNIRNITFLNFYP